MSESDDDGQLREAIALSLRESSCAYNATPTKSKTETSRDVIDLTDSPPNKADTSRQHEGHGRDTAVTSPPTTENPLALGVLGLNRKEMEEQRLARKRKASISPPPARRKQCFSGDERLKPATPTTSVPLPSERRSLHYPRGVVKKTWAFGHAREQDIKIEEVLQRDDLQLAVLSAFQWDVEWLLRKISLGRTKMIFVMQAKEEAVQSQYERETAGMPNLRLCFPSMDGGVNCMHSKLMLLSHPTYLRVVVPSANLVPYDWGESGVMENTVFLIDLPRLDKGEEIQKGKMTFFGRELIHFLEAMGLDDEIVDSIHKFDFSETKGLAFVHSIGGPHVGEEWRRTGYCGLGKAVQVLGLQDEGPMEIDFVTSSIGSLNNDFLKMIYLAAKGDDGMTEYGHRYKQGNKSKFKRNTNTTEPENDVTLLEQIRRNFRIYFPTNETVMHSKGGASCGGTICLQSKWYNSASFPQSLMRDCKSRRAGLLMHNKILFARRQQPSASAGRQSCPAWAYVGSANLSESAWGKLVRDQRTKAPKLTCRNWECGVLIPVHLNDAQPELGIPDSVCNMDVFRAHVPVPMVYPGEMYGTRKPWYFTEQ